MNNQGSAQEEVKWDWGIDVQDPIHEQYGKDIHTYNTTDVEKQVRLSTAGWAKHDRYIVIDVKAFLQKQNKSIPNNPSRDDIVASKFQNRDRANELNRMLVDTTVSHEESARLIFHLSSGLSFFGNSPVLAARYGTKLNQPHRA